jgi:branched-chain amino acid aminotransferase
LAATWELRDGRIAFRGESASIAAASQGLPAGAYTTLRTYQGDRVVRLGQHVQRLIDSARIQGQPASLNEADVRRLLAEALRAQPHPAPAPSAAPESESKLRLTFAPPSLFVSVEPLERIPESLYRDGVWCITVPIHRHDPAAKDTRFLATASAAYQALPPGAHEGLMVAEDGSILEGLSSNFFAVLGGVLHTEAQRALRGITRSIVLELCQGLVPVSLEPVHVADLPRITECFLTSVSRAILPVMRIDKAAIGHAPGPVTDTLMRRFEGTVSVEARAVGVS